MNKTSHDIDQQVLTPVDFDPFAYAELQFTAPSTEAQKEIWASVQMWTDVSCAFNESVSLRLRGSLQAEDLQGAIHDVIQRHEALRTTFSPDGTTLCIASSLSIEIPFIDLSTIDSEQCEEKLAELLQNEVTQPFDLEHGPLLRVHIVKLQALEHLLIFTAHHIICDGWSMNVLMHDLGTLYSARVQGVEVELEEAARFSDYALLQEQLVEDEQTNSAESYWLEQFADTIPILDLPVDHPRPALRSYNATRLDYALGSNLVADLKRVGARSGCTFFTTLLATFEAFLYRLSDQEDLIIGIPAAGQSVVGQDSLVGHCVNLLPLRSRVDAKQRFSDFLKALRKPVLDAYDYQQYTFGSLLKKLPLVRDPGRIPLVSVMFNVDQGIRLAI